MMIHRDGKIITVESQNCVYLFFKYVEFSKFFLWFCVVTTLVLWLQSAEAISNDQLEKLTGITETSCAEDLPPMVDIDGDGGLAIYNDNDKINVPAKESVTFLQALYSDENIKEVTNKLSDCGAKKVNEILLTIRNKSIATFKSSGDEVCEIPKIVDEANIEESKVRVLEIAREAAYKELGQKLSVFKFNSDFVLIDWKKPEYNLNITDGYEVCVKVYFVPSFEQPSATPNYIAKVDTPRSLMSQPLKSILNRDPIKVSVYKNFPPFAYQDSVYNGSCRDKDGGFVGIDIDIACEFSRRWYGDQTKIEILPVSTDCRIPSVIGCQKSCEATCENNKCQMSCEEECGGKCELNQGAGVADFTISSLTDTYPRRRQIDYSDHYFEDGQRLLVRANDRNIYSVCDVNGKIAVTNGSTAKDNLNRIRENGKIAIASGSAKDNFDNKDETCKKINFEIDDSYSTSPSAQLALKQAHVAAFATDSSALITIANKNPDEFKVVGNDFSKELYGIGISKEHEDLKQLIDLTLAQMYNDNTLNDIFCKWLDRAAYPIENNIQSPDDRILKLAEDVRSPLFEHMSKCETKCDSEFTEHTVIRNESLSYIAQKHYGYMDKWETIYDRNRAAIGDNPHRIKAGQTIIVPCIR